MKVDEIFAMLLDEKYKEKGPKSDKSSSGISDLHLLPVSKEPRLVLDPLNPFKEVLGKQLLCFKHCTANLPGVHRYVKSTHCCLHGRR